MLLEKLQAFTVNCIDRVNSRDCFQLQPVADPFLVMRQVIVVSNSDEFCDRVCNDICL